MPTLHFHKDLLPPARAFYEHQLGRLSRANHRGWAAASCPFHKSKSKRSFWVHLDSGAFNCFGCGAHGGDLIDFVRQRDSVSFTTAAQSLGAWDSAPSPETVHKLEAQAAERERQRRLDQEQRDDEHAERMRIREQLHMSMQFQREAERRLDELHAGAEPISANEGEDCWAAMSLSFEYECEMAQEYLVASGLEVSYGE